MITQAPPAIPSSTDTVVRGSHEVQTFYDRVGWTTRSDGVADDTVRFGVLKPGDVQNALHLARADRIRKIITSFPQPMAVIECGCGGNPSSLVMEHCESYTGVDFSETGLQVAAKRVPIHIRTEFVKADLTSLPFVDGRFDAAYSAHVLYHIPSVEGQARAMAEIMRVLRPGGIAILILANPRPLLFPVRFARRVLSDLPGIGHALNCVRHKGPLPYLPLSQGWVTRQLKPVADVEVTSYAIASVWFAQHVSDQSFLGRKLWQTFGWLERKWPRLSARLGSFSMVVAKKK